MWAGDKSVVAGLCEAGLMGGGLRTGYSFSLLHVGPAGPFGLSSYETF